MKRLSMVVLVCSLVLVSPWSVFAQQKDTGKPGGVVVNVIKFEAKVEGIDHQKRTVTLKGPGGNVETFAVGNEVRNFDKVKKGDKVKAEFLERVAVVVRKASEPPAAGEVSTVGVAPKGKKPGLVEVNTTEITADVQAVNYKKHTITLKGPEGRVATFKVDKSVERFSEVKKGDQVVLRVTDALAILVTKK